MLRLSNPDLPITDQGFSVEKNRLFQLYSDLDVRGVGGIIAKIQRLRLGIEEAFFDAPIDKGFFYRVDLTRDLSDLTLANYRPVDLPSLLLGDRLWLRSLEMGIYSRADIAGANTFQVIQLERYRALDPSFDVVITAADIVPTKVSSLGYIYEPGAGDNQWEYSDPTLTIHTTISSQIQPNQIVEIEGDYQLTLPSASLQILSFQVEKDDLIVAVDLLGLSFTPAFDNYNPKAGDFTLSREGVLNLYVPMNISLPEIPAKTLHRVSTGALTYNRLSS